MRYFFLIQPAPLPERLIAADPGFYLEWTLDEWSDDRSLLAEEAVAEYRRCFDDATVRATCEDYRAGATVDLEDDAADRSAVVSCPVLVMWSATGLGASYDVARIWEERAPDLCAAAVNCGHFVAEEAPEEVSAGLTGFLAKPPSRP